MKRVLSGALILLIVLPTFIFGNIYIKNALIFIVALRSIYEINKIFEIKNIKIYKWVPYLASIFILFSSKSQSEINFSFIPVIALASAIGYLFSTNDDNSNDLMNLVTTIFTTLYIDYLLLIFAETNSIINGKYIIWYVFIASWVTDACAYFTGKMIGKHHFTDISPNKTIEGCIGGTIGSVIVSVLYTMFLNKYIGFNINYFQLIPISILISIFGQIGDLVASAIKRYANVKDFSELIPGHGGMLDRIDSILFVAPFTYILIPYIIR